MNTAFSLQLTKLSSAIPLGEGAGTLCRVNKWSSPMNSPEVTYRIEVARCLLLAVCPCLELLCLL